MGFLKSIAKGFGSVTGAAKDAAGSLYDAITGRNDAAAQAGQTGQAGPPIGNAGQAGQDAGQAAAAMMGGQGGSPAEQAGASSGSAAAAMMGGQDSSPAAQAGADAGGALSKQQPAGSAVAPCPAKAGAAAPDVLSAAAQDRANLKYDTLSPADKSLFNDTVNNAGTDRERAYIWKAFAACHTPRECATFAARIRGRTPKWMQDNLSLTGNSAGRGVQQQWSHSCNATTAQAVRGQMDPIYALDTHAANPNYDKVDDADATKENPKLAEEQRQMLISPYHGDAAAAGVAAARGAAGGEGRWADDLFNAASDATGVEYRTEKEPANAVASIDRGLATGAPVPIVIGDANDAFYHYVLVTGSDRGPPKTYTIHDPYDGVTVTRTEQDVKNGRIDLAGWNQISAVEVPVPIVKPAGRPPC